MGGVSLEGGSNKLDVELNLVPFIDLLSTLTLFLLVTAVWLQVAAIPASVDSKGQSAATPQTPPPKVAVHLTPGGIQISWPAGKSGPSTIARRGSAYDVEKLEQVLRGVAQKNPTLMTAVSADDSVEYGWVVQAIDAAKNSGMKSVALSTQ